MKLFYFLTVLLSMSSVTATTGLQRKRDFDFKLESESPSSDTASDSWDVTRFPDYPRPFPYPVYAELDTGTRRNLLRASGRATDQTAADEASTASMNEDQ